MSVASRLDDETAADYYAQALDAAAGLNWDQAQLIRLALSAAQLLPAASEQEKSALALKLRSRIESLRLYTYDPEHLPWMETLEILCRFDPALGLRTVTSWDRANHLDLGYGIRSAARSLHRHGHLDVREAMQLLWLTNEDSQCSYDGITILTDAKERGQESGDIEAALEWLGNRILKDQTSGSRFDDCASVADWARDEGLGDNDTIRRLVAVNDAAPVDPDQYQNRHRRRWLQGDGDSSEPAGPEEFPVGAANADVSLLVEHLDECAQARTPPLEIRDLLNRVGQELTPNVRIAALSTLASIGQETKIWRHYGYEIGYATLSWSSSWSRAQRIRQWVIDNWPRLLLERFPDFARSYESDASVVGLWLSLEWIDRPTQSLLSAVSRHMHALDVHQSLKIAELLSEAVPSGERLPMLHWVLDQLPKSENQEPAVDLGGSEAGTIASNVLAEFTWALLGHPDARVRWRGARLALGQTRLSPDYLEALVGLYLDRSGRGHHGAGRQFFWMSAQVWMMIVMRAARGSPARELSRPTGLGWQRSLRTASGRTPWRVSWRARRSSEASSTMMKLLSNSAGRFGSRISRVPATWTAVRDHSPLRALILT